jgi:serine/threonine protein kinase
MDIGYNEFGWKPQAEDLFFGNPDIYLFDPFQRFDLEEVLGSGSHDTKVWLATDEFTGQEYALKLLIKHKKLRSTYKQDMMRMEVGAMMDIATKAAKEPESAQYACQLRELWESKEYIMVVMDPCGEQNLQEFLRPLPNYMLNEKYSKMIFTRLAHGLKFIHELGYCHRDIKMMNVAIDMEQ